ncbi:DNA-damage inducible protein, putative [Eimeria maxima]|uniref:DNA-damage inducible protein, putative n=1 Tax=Eimeria maxima TaxID=5804 RepID=U6LYD3_EIMMA|nr:DNA-damage inducible protein, putative [Eimeria maxima]CDJ56967.1 DNA-damage inducible protein, putative [Eimeria maxima]
MQITVTDPDGQIFTLDLTGEAEISALKDIISVEFNIPPERQRILLDGQPLRNTARTLAEARVGEGAMLLVFNEPPPPAGTTTSPGIPGSMEARTQQAHQLLTPRAQTPQRQQPPTTLPFDFSSIVVDGGRVAEFPAGETIVPSRRASPAAPAASTRTSPPAIPGVANTPPSTPGSEAHVKVLIRRRAEAAVAAARADPTSLSLIRAHNPVLGDAIKAAADERDAALVREGTDGAQQAESGTAMKQLVELIEKEYEAQKKAESERLRRMQAVQRDPLSQEAQQFLLEELQQERINENYSMAREHLPEGFGSVCMLYIDVAINGVPCKAFVDSGAQQSILSLEFAEKCSLASLIDKRFAGLAMGVGKAPIIGRVHLAPLKLGTKFCPCSFIVLEDTKMQMLLGLDMLRRYQMIIDLKKNALIVEGEEIPFLSEAQIGKGLFGTGEVESAKTAEKPEAPK